MRAPVYRSIDAGNTFLGLAFPSEVLLVLFVFWIGMLLAPPGSALLATLGTGVGIRLATLGRAPQFVQHLLMFRFRRLRTGGHFTAAARAHAQGRFPFAEYRFRAHGSLARARSEEAHVLQAPLASAPSSSPGGCDG